MSQSTVELCSLSTVYSYPCVVGMKKGRMAGILELLSHDASSNC